MSEPFSFGDQPKVKKSVLPADVDDFGRRIEWEREIIARALADYVTKSPNTEADLRQIVAGMRDKSALYVFEQTLIKNATVKSLEELTINTIPVRTPKDRNLICRAMAALSVRAETSEQKRAVIIELCIAAGINLDQFDEAVAELQIPDNPERNLEWRTKDGKTIRLSEMEDSHLINSIKFMERAAKVDMAGEILLQYALLAFKPSRKVRDLIAWEAKKDKPEAPAMYWALRREAERRGYNLGAAEVKTEGPADKPKRAAPKPGMRAFNFDD